MSVEFEIFEFGNRSVIAGNVVKNGLSANSGVHLEALS